MKKIIACAFSLMMFVSFAHAADSSFSAQNKQMDGVWGAPDSDC